MAQLRRNHRCLRSRSFFYYFQESRVADQIVAYRRSVSDSESTEAAIVILNFSDATHTITLPFPWPGTYQESIDKQAEDAIVVTRSDEPHSVTVSSNYGKIYLLQS